MKYKIQHETMFQGWIDGCTDGETGLPVLFDTRKEAEADLKEFLHGIEEAVKSGHMQDVYRGEEWRVVEEEESNAPVPLAGTQL